MELMDYLPKLVLASIIGYIFGIERSRYGSNGSIGIGTASVLCIGATLLTIISKYGLSTSDPSRILANIVTGVSFLCGSVIFMSPNDGNTDDMILRGLTTSVLLFCLTGIGIAIGLGHFGLAITTTIIVEINIFFSRLRKKGRKKKDISLKELQENEDELDK